MYAGVVYQAINIQNNKSYIGYTTKNFDEYKKRHLRRAKNNNKKNKVFYNAIRKYGIDNFKWIVLGELTSRSKNKLKLELNKAEIESIWLFRTYGSDGENYDQIYGYNMTLGGDGGATNTGKTASKETREKMRQKALGNKNSKGHERSDLTKEKMRQKAKLRYCDPDERYLQSLRRKNKGRKCVDNEKIIELYNQGHNMSEIGLTFGVSRSTIERRIKEIFDKKEVNK